MSAVALAPHPLAPTVFQLARVEGARLLRHPVVLVALALSVASTIAWSQLLGGDYFAVSGSGLLPLLAALVATNLAALRSRRSDTDELYDSLPAPARTRTLAHLLSLGWLFAGCALYVAAFTVALGGLDGFVIGYDGTTLTPSLAEFAQGPAAVTAVAAIGIALARWIPFLPTGPVLAAGLVLFQMPATSWNLQSAWVWFLPIVNAAETPPHTSFPCASSGEGVSWCGEPVFQVTAVGWHLLYLAGIAVVAGALALMRHDRRPVTLAGLVVGLLLVAVAGVSQIP